MILFGPPGIDVNDQETDRTREKRTINASALILVSAISALCFVVTATRSSLSVADNLTASSLSKVAASTWRF